MHFFSRKKALFTASLAALGGLAACGDDVTVPVPPTPQVVISITPGNATMNIGESLNFAVQITGGSTTTPPTLTSCTSSNTAIATAAVTGSTCRVTAVAAGNATITAAATGGQVASSAVTVTAQANAISNLTLSPTTANLAPSQTVTLTPNVQRGATGNTIAYTYASSNLAVATVGPVQANGSVVVTAVAPGVATITATAVGTGTGFSQNTLTASATINVGSAPSGITTLNVQPSSLNLAVGRTAGITANVAQPAGAPAATITYTSSNPAVATVSSTGVVTALTPGSTNITVRAQSAASANGAFAASDISQVVAVTVSPVANVSIQAINQGPYVTTGIDSAYSVTPPAGTPPGTPPTGPASGIIAGIRRDLNPQVGQPIDVTNTKDQIQVILNLQANGQRIDSVVVFIDSGTTGTSTVRRAAARQVFTNGDAGNNQTVTIEAFILTEDFTANDATGVGDVAYVNGLKRISASVFTTLSQGQTCTAGGTPAPNNTTPCELQNAANIRQNVNFNNIDGFALRMTNPPNSNTDVDGRTWWGGPTVSPISRPSGLGRFQVYPVIYTPNRFIRQVSATFGRCLGFQASNLPNFVTDSAAPFIFQFGKTAPASPEAGSMFIGCDGIVGAYDRADNFRLEDYPMVVGSLDSQNNAGPRTLYAYNPTLFTDPFAGPRPTLFRSSPQLTNPNPIRVDYENPALTLAVTGTNLGRFVNDSYQFSSGYSATDYVSNPPITGVGLFAARNVTFFVASANPMCGPQSFQPIGGTLTTASIANVFQIGTLTAPNGARESPCDFTNNAFLARAVETDRLGNLGTIGDLGQPGTAGVIAFGIDNTAPEISASWDGAGPIADTPNHYRATLDSIFQPQSAVGGATPIANSPAANATDFYFGIRYTDTRSGFDLANHGTRTVQRYRPNDSPQLSQRAVIETVSFRTMTFAGGNGNPVENEDPRYRRDSVTIYGAGPLGGALGNGLGPDAVLTPTPRVGYYLYSVNITDRAGNASSLRQRAVIDATSPVVTGTGIPPVFGAGGTGAAVAQTFTPTGTDDVEIIDFDMFLRYQAMAMVGDSSSGSTVIADGARIRFRRDRFADVHSPFAVFNDTLLATPVGFGSPRGGTGVTLPIPSIRGIEPVDSTNAPIAYGAGATNPFTGFKPDRIGVYAFDVRASHIGTGFPAPYANNPPFRNLGMTNLFPSGNASGGEAAYTENLFTGIVSNGIRWDTKDLNVNTPGLDRLVSWTGVGGTGATLQFQATTSTVVTQAPFPLVHLFKWEVDAQHTGSGVTSVATSINDSASGQWVYVGTVGQTAPVNPVINDQGATRIWTYFFTAAAFPAVTNGSIIQPGVTTGCYRAVGVDGSGDGITTRSFGTGCPSVVGPNASQIRVVTGPVNQTLTIRAFGNGTGVVTVTTGAPFGLIKTDVNGVQRVSQNRPNTGEVLRITPTNGSTVDRTPQGCTPTTPVAFPTANEFLCSYSLFTPTTFTVIFESASGVTP